MNTDVKSDAVSDEVDNKLKISVYKSLNGMLVYDRVGRLVIVD